MTTTGNYPSPSPANRWRGFIYGAVAAATYGMNPLFSLPLYKEGLSVDSVLFYRYTLAAAILGIWMKSSRQSFALRKQEILPMLLAGLCFSFSSLFLFISYKKMDAGIASTILFVYPVMVALLMAVFFREKMTRATWLCIMLTLSGIAMLYRNSDGLPLSGIGIILVMFSALSYAIYLIGVNRSALKLMAVNKLTFYALLSGLSVYVVRLDFGAGLQSVPSFAGAANILALALLPTIVSLACTTRALQYLGPTPTAILGALEPVTAIFFGVLLFNEILTCRMIIGVLLIITAVTMLVLSKKNPA